jgi:ATP-binding cassette subfamily F protein 3
MAFAQAVGISLAFGDRDILKDVNINLSAESRIGLSGANGSGKSTLMKIIAGIMKPDTGTVSVPKGVRISYLPQSGLVHEGSNLKSEAEKAFDFYRDKIREKEELASRLARLGEGSPETQELLLAHHELEEFVLESGFYSRGEVITQTLLGLGVSTRDFERDCSEFSGGWQMRIALAKVLLSKPDILLLDEPTNYLDLEARAWLLSFIQKFKGGLIIVSHDRYFLDETISEVAELFLGRLKRYKGNYSEYERVRKQELESLLAQYKAREEEIEKTEDFINRFRYNASKAQLVQSRIKYLEKLPRIEIPESMKTLHFTFPPPPH